MVEQVRTFLEADWKKLAKDFDDFTEPKQAALRKAMNRCAADFEFPLAKPYDADHENFKYFALCLRSSVTLNPALGSSRGVRSSVLGWQF